MRIMFWLIVVENGYNYVFVPHKINDKIFLKAWLKIWYKFKDSLVGIMLWYDIWFLIENYGSRWAEQL